VKIAQVASLIESIPPKRYGGAERIVSYLTEELVAQGHEVTLFASEQSVTAAKLVACCQQPLRLDPRVKDVIPHYMIMLDNVRTMAADFDIIHVHFDQFHFPVLYADAQRTLTTLHGRQDLPDLQLLYRAFPGMQLVSVSDAQRAPIPCANFVATVQHGLPLGLLEPNPTPCRNYLAFLGRISPEKGVERAVAIARAASLPLKIAAKIDRLDEPYFESTIAPLLEPPRVEFVGEIDEVTKEKFLGEALALLFPIDWPEPFGLVMIESMACGTPVIAFDKGAVREIIDEGVTGHVVQSVPDAIEALRRVLAFDRTRVRQRFEERFSASRMAADYVRVYQQLLDRSGRSRRSADRHRRAPMAARAASRQATSRRPPRGIPS
jgi:glycosyltransferase involved in cell wall biosynthesis